MEDAVLIPEGFNFWAFLLTGFWALYHRLWLAFVGFIVVTVLCNIAVYVFGGGFAMDFLLSLVIGIGFGLLGNDLRRRKLAARGYKLVDIVTAHDETGAAYKFFVGAGRLPAAATSAVPPSPNGSFSTP